MARLSSFTFITLNGYYKGPNNDINWHRHGAEEGETAEAGAQVVANEFRGVLARSQGDTACVVRNVINARRHQAAFGKSGKIKVNGFTSKINTTLTTQFTNAINLYGNFNNPYAHEKFPVYRPYHLHGLLLIRSIRLACPIIGYGRWNGPELE